MRTIYQVFPKESISKLPRLLFDGPITIIDTPDAMLEALNILQKENRVGIDTETRPSFKKGQNHHVGLLQISTRQQAFLFRLNLLGFPQPLADFLENANIEKVGLSLSDDFLQLRHRKAKLNPKCIVEIQELAKQYGIDDMSLRKLCANLLGRSLSKRQQLSNWNAPELNEAQQRYAATDAWVCLLLWDQFNELKNKSYHFIKHIPENVETNQFDA